jgi:hypothetical protein
LGLGGDDKLGRVNIDEADSVVLDVVTEYEVAAADRLKVREAEGHSFQAFAIGEAEDARVSDASAYAYDLIVAKERIGAGYGIRESFTDLDGGAGA